MKNEILEKIKGMIGVRKIIALMMTAVFSYMAVSGIVTPQEFLPVFSMVIGYYFGKSTALEHPDYTVTGEPVMSNKPSTSEEGPTVG